MEYMSHIGKVSSYRWGNSGPSEPRPLAEVSGINTQIMLRTCLKKKKKKAGTDFNMM